MVSTCADSDASGAATSSATPRPAACPPAASASKASTIRPKRPSSRARSPAGRCRRWRRPGRPRPGGRRARRCSPRPRPRTCSLDDGRLGPAEVQGPALVPDRGLGGAHGLARGPRRRPAAARRRRPGRRHAEDREQHPGGKASRSPRPPVRPARRRSARAGTPWFSCVRPARPSPSGAQPEPLGHRPVHPPRRQVRPGGAAVRRVDQRPVVELDRLGMGGHQPALAPHAPPLPPTASSPQLDPGPVGEPLHRLGERQGSPASSGSRSRPHPGCSQSS